MRIGIDAGPIGNRSGTGYYTQKLVEFLGRVDSENEYVLFCPRGYEQALERRGMFDYPNFRIEQVSAPGQAAQFVWKQFMLSRLAERYRLDLIHYPSFIASLRTETPSVLTVHDLCFSLYPQTFSRMRRPYYRYMVPRSIGRCDSVIVDSLSTRRDVLDHMSKQVAMKDGRVEAVHLGVDPVSFFPIKDEKERRRVARKYGLPQQFILYVGTLEPRKNLSRLIRAFAYGIATRGLPHHLVIAGRKGWLFQEVFKEVRLLNLCELVHFPGYIQHGDLPALYSMAQAFAYPSLYEGFGLPCLEAMSCGTPVIASNTSSLPEVVGECGLMVDPCSVDSMAEALRTVCTDADLRKRLSEAGIRRASRFSWLTTAKKTLEVYVRTRKESR